MNSPDPQESPVPKKPAASTRWERTKLETTSYFTDRVTLFASFVPLCFLSLILYIRHPLTNFIFDEQEALLANPYVRVDLATGKAMHWYNAFTLDFWGLPPNGTIGSYRPLPNLLWRTLWWIPQVRHSPFFHHFFLNVAGHGLNGALMVLLVYRWTKRNSIAWATGLLFLTSAVMTEAVCGVVGIADVLSVTGALVALLALSTPLYVMPYVVFVATLFGLLSKESALCLVPLIPLAALFTSHVDHREKPLAWLRAALALLATAGAFVLYVESRRRNFPTLPNPDLSVEANAHKGTLARTFAGLLRWYAQPMLPRDPLNNPLIEATTQLRVAGGLRVFWRGLVQVIFPWTLSGDYSAPQEPAPARFWSIESGLGLFALGGLPLTGMVLAVLGVRADRKKAKGALVNDIDLRPVAGLGLIWLVVSFFPVSNIPVLLPTVRAERFWYFPVVGSALALGMLFGGLWRMARSPINLRLAVGACVGFVAFQSLCARKHANHYRDDLAFWDAARQAVPNSAKAHLNYSVMLGARQDLEGRLTANKRAYELAPKWPMASVYMGDTICRLHRPMDAMPDYERGFALAPNDQHLIALGLQCLWDEHAFDNERVESPPTGANERIESPPTGAKTVQEEEVFLRDKRDKEEESPVAPPTASSPPTNAFGEALRQKSLEHPGSWYAYLVEDILLHGKENKGVDPKYRPRSYNEGPKK